MSEFLTQPNNEEERFLRLGQLIDQYLQDDKEFLDDMDEEDKLNYVYGALLEAGENPDMILHEFGVIE